MVANGIDIDRHKRRVQAYKTSSSQGYLDRIRDKINDGFTISPSYFDIAVNGKDRGVHIIEGLEGNNFILTRPGEDMSVGDIVQWNGDKFLCIYVRNNKAIQTKAEIQKCNETVTWQDEQGAIHTTPAIVQDKTSVYSDGLSKKEHISIGSDQVSFTVQSNELTKKIPLNKRIVFNNSADDIYETNRKDNILNKGLTLIVGKKSLYDPNKDRLDLNIADYIDVEPPTSSGGSDSTELTMLGDGRMTVWDSKVEFKVDTTQEVRWTLDTEDYVYIAEVDNNKCYLSPVDVGSIGNSVLTAHVTTSNGEKTVTKHIELLYQ